MRFFALGFKCQKHVFKKVFVFQFSYFVDILVSFKGDFVGQKCQLEILKLVCDNYTFNCLLLSPELRLVPNYFPSSHFYMVAPAGESGRVICSRK